MNPVSQAVTDRERLSEKQPFWKEEKMTIPGIVLGAVIYSIGINYFLRPLNLYAGGFMGFCQLITTLLKDYLGLNFGNLDLAGIFYYILNLPGLLLGLRLMRRRFIVKTILSVSLITLLLTIVPIPSAPILDEIIANCLIAGIMGGAGVGLILRTGSCDGGMDLIGMIMIQQKGHFSVGKINIAANAVLYGLCFILFEPAVAIYSLIYSVCSSFACDHVHTQNINVQVLVVTKLKDTQPMEIEIMGRMARGLTRMDATGSYTGEHATVFLMVVSKYEIHKLLGIIREFDPEAFLMMDEGVQVSGRFLKKLT